MRTAIALIYGMLICISVPILANEDDVELRIKAAYRATGEDLKFYYIPSHGLIADQTFVIVSRSEGPSRPAQELAQVIINSDRKPLTIGVSCPSGKKAVQVIKDAFTATNKLYLSKLKLVFVGDKSSAKKVEKLVAEMGATFVFVEY